MARIHASLITTPDPLKTADLLFENTYNGRTVLLFGDKHEQLVMAYEQASAEATQLGKRCEELEEDLKQARSSTPVESFSLSLDCDTTEATATIDVLAAKVEKLDALIDTMTSKLKRATGQPVHVPPKVRDACRMLADPANLNEADRLYRLGLLERRELPDDHEWLQRQGFVYLYDAPLKRLSS